MFMKEKYVLINFKNLDGLYLIKRITGGTVANGYTIKKYEIVYPEKSTLDARTIRLIKQNIRGDGNTTLPTAYKKEKFSTDIYGIIKSVFENPNLYKL